MALDVSGLTALVARGERAHWLACQRWCRVHTSGCPPPQPACGGELYAGAPAGLGSGAVPRRCGGGLLHAEIVWYESFLRRARWSLGSCMARFFEAAAAGVCVALILCGNQSTASLGWFLGHGQVISNDQVDDDFALALEPGGFGHEALALIQCGLDLVTDRDQSLERYLRGTFELSRECR